MERQSQRLAGILFVLIPTVMYGGVSLLGFLLDRNSGYMANPLRQNLFRAGHAHAGVLLVLSLVVLRYVDEARLSQSWKRFVRVSPPVAAILLPVAFFLSVPLSGLPGRGGASCRIDRVRHRPDKGMSAGGTAQKPLQDWPRQAL